MSGKTWLPIPEFAALAGIGDRSARAAASQARWRGHRLETRRVFGRGGKSGLSYQVSLSSLSEALEAPLNDTPWPDYGETVSREITGPDAGLGEGSGYAPFQVGLTFMGNNEFALRSGANGQSVISAAVADRALFVEGLSYQDLTAEDLRLIVEARLEIDDDALELAIKALMARPDRSFRAAIRFCLEVHEEAAATAAATITRPHVAAVIGLA